MEKKYRDTIKMLELSDKGLKTADIARALSIRYNDVQALRRTAASTLAYVDKRISEKLAYKLRGHHTKFSKG